MISEEVLISLNELHKELEKLRPAVQLVKLAEKTVDEVSKLPQISIDLSNKISESVELTLKQISKLSNDEFVRLSSKNSELHDNVKVLMEDSGKKLLRVQELVEELKALRKKIDAVDFPIRLDKLDANVSGIMAAVQSVQSRIDNMERNFLDKLRDISDKQQNGVYSLSNSIEALQKKQPIYSYVTWGLIFVSLVTLIVLKS